MSAPRSPSPHPADHGFAADLVLSMRCGLITVDHVGRVLTMNQRAEEILDLDGAAVVGHQASSALAAHPNLARLLSQSLSLDTLPDRAEMEIRSRDRQGRTLGFTLSRVKGKDGAVRGAALFFKDLTPIEREEERAQLQERLASLGAMAASMAHEIRNPLAALELTTTLLRRKLPKESAEAQMAETLQQQIRRLSSTVNNCLEFVRPLAVTRVPTDIVAVVEEALEAAAAGSTPGVTLIRELPDAVRPLAVDGVALRQAVLNLVRNALEAMVEKGGVLRVVLEMPSPEAVPAPGDAAVIRVLDSGPGIAEDIRQKIFNPFFSTKTQGSGLGLAWTRKVVDAHGGVLDVDSRPGRGAVFTIRLPLPTAATAPELIPTGEMLHEAQDTGC